MVGGSGDAGSGEFEVLSVLQDFEGADRLSPGGSAAASRVGEGKLGATAGGISVVKVVSVYVVCFFCFCFCLVTEKLTIE